MLLDLLGHGRSDKPTHASTYRIDSYAEQVIALLDHLGVEGAVLGGISLGANVSLFAATRYPERTRALILEMPVLERARCRRRPWCSCRWSSPPTTDGGS